ncbi:MAG: hypothetical protein D6835_00405 [Candidatus Thermofonsia bacterium]|nr:MAG: hypothetical protein D6835_00405 [Candidatus Thermofonsia bacterium]
MGKQRPFLLWFIALITIFLLAACRTTPPYHETFDEPGSWRTGDDFDTTGLVQNGVFDLTVKADDLFIWTTAGKTFSDGIYEVEATPIDGPLNNGYGMLFRVDNEHNNFYLFKISGDGYVWIGKYQNGGATLDDIVPLVGDWWFESTAVNQGLNVTNHLKVQAEGANLIFYVNNQEVGRVTDNSFTSGDIGLMVETLGLGGVRVTFDNFKVTPINH